MVAVLHVAMSIDHMSDVWSNAHMSDASVHCACSANTAAVDVSHDAVEAPISSVEGAKCHWDSVLSLSESDSVISSPLSVAAQD